MTCHSLLFRHLHAQFVALDGNFRLKQKERNTHDDGGLTAGCAYFVEPKAFSRELGRSESQPQLRERSTCDSSFAAIERANTRMNHGYVVTGVVAAIDSRHGFVLPNGVADLQKGEKSVPTL